MVHFNRISLYFVWIHHIHEHALNVKKILFFIRNCEGAAWKDNREECHLSVFNKFAIDRTLFTAVKSDMNKTVFNTDRCIVSTMPRRLLILSVFYIIYTFKRHLPVFGVLGYRHKNKEKDSVDPFSQLLRTTLGPSICSIEKKVHRHP